MQNDGMQQPIGVFDSGVGGLSVLRALRSELPAERFVYFSDAGHAPYGEKSDAFVAQRSRAILRQLLDEHRVKALVVACNTATAAAIHLLREEVPHLPIVGVEPALKPAAAASRTRRVAVLATRGTLSSAKFRALHDALRDQAEFVLQPCDGLAAAIESGDAQRVRALCRDYAAAAGPFGTAAGQADVMVLGCTHYPFAAEAFRAHVGEDVLLMETGAPVARQTRRLLDEAGLLHAQGEHALHFASSGPMAALEAAAARWL